MHLLRISIYSLFTMSILKNIILKGKIFLAGNSPCSLYSKVSYKISNCEENL